MGRLKDRVLALSIFSDFALVELFLLKTNVFVLSECLFISSTELWILWCLSSESFELDGARDRSDSFSLVKALDPRLEPNAEVW